MKIVKSMYDCALLTILLRPKTSQILSTGGTVIGTTCDVISSALRLWRSVCLYIHPAWVVCHLSLLTGSEGLGRGVSGQQPALFYEFARKYGFVGATSCSLLRLPLGHTRGRKQMYCLGRVYVQHRLSCYQRISLST